MSRTHCLAAVLAVALVAAADPTNKLPDAAQAALEKADQIDVLSLDPVAGDTSKDAFHKYKVLGKTTVKDEDARKALTAAVLKGVADSKGVAAMCFNPRHGLRVVSDDKTYDLVICFECLQIQAFEGDKKMGGALTTGSAQETLDKILKDAGVPLADKPK